MFSRTAERRNGTRCKPTETEKKEERKRSVDFWNGATVCVCVCVCVRVWNEVVGKWGLRGIRMCAYYSLGLLFSKGYIIITRQYPIINHISMSVYHNRGILEAL